MGLSLTNSEEMSLYELGQPYREIHMTSIAVSVVLGLFSLIVVIHVCAFVLDKLAYVAAHRQLSATPPVWPRVRLAGYNPRPAASLIARRKLSCAVMHRASAVKSKAQSKDFHACTSCKTIWNY